MSVKGYKLPVRSSEELIYNMVIMVIIVHNTVLWTWNLPFTRECILSILTRKLTVK